MVAAAEADIREQPAVVARLLEAERPALERLAMRLDLDDVRYVLVAGRGSSDNAARYAHYLFGAQRRWPVALATPSLFTRYGAPPRLDGALVVAVSQSGASGDVVEVVHEAERQGRPSIAITNTPGSPLAGAARHVLLLQVGVEQTGVATKSYVASLAAFALLSAAVGRDEGMFEHLAELPDLIATTIDDAAPVAAAVAERFAEATHAAVIGRGFNLATAQEVALKLTSLTRTTAVGYSAADAVRGPMASVVDEAPVLLVAPSGRVLSDVVNLIPTMRARRVPLVTISDVDEVLDEGDGALRLPSTREWASPLVAVVPGQLLALELGRRQGTLTDR